MPLSNQDKLALALTSAGSMRNLAKLVGVTHQKIGRWLREGEPTGAKKIPADATGAIDAVFQLHKDVTKDQAKIDRFPYNPQAPVFAERPTLRNGKPGERLAVNNTEYIKPQLRNKIFEDLQKTKQIQGISVRSQINLRSYLKAKPTDNASDLSRKFTDRRSKKYFDDQGKRVTEYKDERGRLTLLGSFKKREETSPGTGFIAPINITAVDFRPQADIELSINNINTLLKKHSPHATVFADQFLIQTLPGQYENQAKPKRQTAAQKRIKLIRR